MVLAIHRFPITDSDLGDLKSAAARYILPGYAPPAPFLRRDDSVLTAGSCFAENIMTALTEIGVRATTLRVEEMANTPFATQTVISKIIRNQSDAGEHLPLIKAASLFVLTVGVSLQRFEDGVPYYFGGRNWTKSTSYRMLSVDEICGYIRSIIAMMREVKPDIHIVLTLSPIPLTASIEHPSVVGQDCLSKSLLRVAIETILSEHIANLTYWPSFEIVRWLPGHFGAFFGVDGAEDHRHIAPDVLKTIMEMFVERYFIS